MIQIDGGQGEGGGQILRTALSLSCLTGEALHIHNIRQGRRNPGLAPQHLAGVQACARICQAEVKGAAIGSQEVRFTPGGPVVPGEHILDISELAGRGSAGSVILLLQAILLPLALVQGRNSRLVLRGGTHVAWSPPVHYAQQVWLPALAKIGVRAEIALKQWGWYPQGGGEVEVTIRGGAILRGISFQERGDLEVVEGETAASNLPAHIPQRIANRAANVLRAEGIRAKIKPVRTSGPSTGAGIFLTARYGDCAAGFSALGAKGKPSEQVANEACAALLSHHAADMPVDPHLADQLVLPLALAEGPSSLHTSAITRHTLTVCAVARQFIPRTINVTGAEGCPGHIQFRNGV